MMGKEFHPDMNPGKAMYALPDTGINKNKELSPGTRRIVLAIILVGTFMANLDSVMVNVALPTITTFYHANLSLSQWTISGYILAMTSLMIIFAKISEYSGILRLYLTGFILFTISSLACGLSATLGELILFRIIQGIGASMVYCGVGPLILHASLPHERGKAMGWVTAAVAAATMMGPVIGGFITDILGWQYIFYINVPLGIVLLACALKKMKIPETRSDRLTLDWIGAGALVTMIVSLLLFCGEIASGIALTAPVVAYAILFVISVSVFLSHESRCVEPLIDLTIFRNTRFTISTVCTAFFFAVLNMTNIVGPFYLEGVMGYTPTRVGLFFLIIPVLMFVVSPWIGRVYDRNHGDYATAGLIIIALSCLVQSAASITVCVWLIILAFVMRGIGSGFFQGPNNTEILTSLPREKTAISSSVASTARTFGIAVGVLIASISMTLELAFSGYQGPVPDADPGVLAGATSITLLIGGGICIIAVIISRFRRHGTGGRTFSS